MLNAANSQLMTGHVVRTSIDSQMPCAFRIDSPASFYTEKNEDGKVFFASGSHCFYTDCMRINKMNYKKKTPHGRYSHLAFSAYLEDIYFTHNLKQR
jgi:hypothetical protein